jgi:EAL domain-containing protein (putative c-di-GMP-specific phosphodiesterase class I)
VAERWQLVEDLRAALVSDHLFLQYQPQHDGAGAMVGAEALLRWRHPQRGLVSPAIFIPLAEQAGLMETLGQWVLNTACGQLSRWLADEAMATALGEFSLAVNVSAHQFRSPGCVDSVARVVRHWGIAPGRLKLELTESMMVHDVDDIVAKMHAIRGLGVRFSLDDFGTGYSSLSQLKRLPLDQLKIDQSFVREVMHSTNDAAIARTVVALGQTLGLEVIAEGVETEAQRDYLRGMGCFHCQGYLFSKPIDSDIFKAYALVTNQ